MLSYNLTTKRVALYEAMLAGLSGRIIIESVRLWVGFVLTQRRVGFVLNRDM